jgi:lipoic acid synthetase
MKTEKHIPKPDWLKIKVSSCANQSDVTEILKRHSLHTVCDEANCPNKMECFSKKTATFMILGRICTRNCTFCNVENNPPRPPDREEPRHTAQAVKELGLKHVVITSVTRDDLPDGGASHFADTINEIRALTPEVIIEVLIPDFLGDIKALERVISAGPEIINHNVETVPRLYPEVRPQAVYKRSLELLKNIKHHGSGISSKSGIMLGLGEKEEEVLQVLRDLREAECDMITIGQYLAPGPGHYPVAEYIHPDKFDKYRQIALALGFRAAAAGPFVRSSYMAERVYKESV